MFFGGIVIFFGYLFRRYARYCDELDSIKDIKDGDKKVGVDPRSTFADKTASLVIGKRIKHKKRREVMQEFSHTWVAGALKGHTGTIFNMNLSSNGKQLASCGEGSKE
ncbi:hypothetical protein M0802_004751 [Mischocyttarus mexicanus]|nr:hypothetical protein M0802_004751 [Mischocyttarus mexicanus]